MQNFRPFAPCSGQSRIFQSPAHRLSQKLYHPHWLHNMQGKFFLSWFQILDIEKVSVRFFSIKLRISYSSTFLNHY